MRVPPGGSTSGNKNFPLETFPHYLLTQSTAEALLATLKSVKGLSAYLLPECEFKYILTAKMNQDPLECFFGILRKAGGQNKHPTFATFLPLCRMLSLQSLLRPPQFGNCTAAESGQSAFVTLADFTGICKSSAVQRPKKVEELRHKLDGVIAKEAAVAAYWPRHYGDFKKGLTAYFGLELRRLSALLLRTQKHRRHTTHDHWPNHPS